jgi:hypothetical protein
MLNKVMDAENFGEFKHGMLVFFSLIMLLSD